MFRKTLFLTLLLALALAACGPASVPTERPVVADQIEVPTEAVSAIVLTDGLGREVRLDSLAQRVVSLAPSNTEILYAIGAGSQVVGRDEFSDYPGEAKAIDSVGGSMGEFNQEAIVALKPDLVLAAELNPPELVKALEGLGLTVYYLKNPKTLEEMYGNLEIVAKLTGHGTEAQALIDSLKVRVSAVDEKIATVTEKPVTYYELDATDVTKPWTAGPGTFVDQIIQRAGGQNVGAVLQGDWAQISTEQMVVSNPQVIVLGDAVYGVTFESVKARVGWDVMDAVKNDRIYTFDDNLTSRPGPRLVDALEQMAKLLHPELFK